MSINLYGNDSIEFNNCTISKNIGQYGRGGGVSIRLNGNGCIDFNKCNISSNIAQDKQIGGRRVKMYSHNGSIELYEFYIVVVVLVLVLF